MAYDAHLADRVRELLLDGSNVTEQKMFGALAFLVAGTVAVAANHIDDQHPPRSRTGL